MSEHAPSTAQSTSGQQSVVFTERLWVPLWWWVVGVAAAELLAVEIHLAARSWPAWIPFVILLPVPIWACLWLSRFRLTVTEDTAGCGEFRIERAHIPFDAIARTLAVPATAKSAALGRQLDPSAFVRHRTWIKTMILIVLDDPDDPTPYWLVSTRRPAELSALLPSDSAADGTAAANRGDA